MSVFNQRKAVAVIGGGPAGLRAAEVISSAGIPVDLFDACPSVGRKLLVAGKGGLNLTHTEPFDAFWRRYHPHPERWRALLEVFPPDALREWCHGLEIETYVGTSRRVYPLGNQAGRLLRRWVQRLKSQGVRFHMRHRWCGMTSCKVQEFEAPEGRPTAEFSAVVLAMGGASWPQTGSNGAWVEPLRKIGIEVKTLVPSNVGFRVNWPGWLLEKWEGAPIKNVVVRFEGQEIPGDLMITREGIEGTPIYHLSRFLRESPNPGVTLDLKPGLSEAQLLQRWKPSRGFLRDVERCWKISTTAKALLAWIEPERTPEAWARRLKTCPLKLEGPGSLDQAISSAGGVAWEELDNSLMLRKIPGVFCAGEMLEGEAPTGGYLLQGAFASGTVAGQSVVKLWNRLKVGSV